MSRPQFTPFVVYDEDIVRVLVRGGRDVRVIELLRVLKGKEKAHVAMAIFFSGLDNISFEDEIAESLVFN